MARQVELHCQVRDHGERRIKITPAWAGKGIAIHKPIGLDPETREVYFREVQGLWNLTHINTGLAIGSCHGNLDRAKGFARQWDADFAALQPGQAMAPDRLQAWAAVVQEMKTEKTKPPRKRASRRGRKVAA
jgi:hypothetical protein